MELRSKKKTDAKHRDLRKEGNGTKEGGIWAKLEENEPAGDE